MFNQMYNLLALVNMSASSVLASMHYEYCTHIVPPTGAFDTVLSPQTRNRDVYYLRNGGSSHSLDPAVVDDSAVPLVREAICTP